MFKLIRDNVPAEMKEAGEKCYYAVAETAELFVALLHAKLVEEVDKFLVSSDVESLIEIETVIRALVKASGMPEADFDKAYAAKLAKSGGFDKKLLALFPDPKPEEAKSTK